MDPHTHELKIGLVLSGGGAKGAYEAGVFRTLWELDLVDQVKVISGTSVGAVNALLFSMNDRKIIHNSWNTISYSRFINNEEKSRRVNLPGLVRKLRNIHGENIVIQELDQNDIGLISQKGIQQFIEEYVDMEVIRESKRDIYACAYNIDRNRPEYFQLNGYDKEEMLEVVLASCAIPFLFPPRIIAGNRYADGGIQSPEYIVRNIDNVPITPLAGYDLDMIIVVHLNDKKKEERRIPPGIMEEKIIDIYPSKSIERIGGTGGLYITHSSLSENIELGYRDSMVTLAPMIVKYLRQRRRS